MKFEKIAEAWIATTLLFVPWTARAMTAAPGPDEAIVRQCIQRAARGTFWLEKTLWGLRDQEAGWIGAQVPNTNGTYDLGILQINSSWVPSVARLVQRPQAQVRHWLQFDPCFNTETARWLFLTALSQTHDFWKAVGIYHSPTAKLQKKYALSVAGHLHRRFGPDVFKANDKPSINKAADFLQTEAVKD